MNSSVTLDADTKIPGSTIRTGKIVVNLEQRLVTVDGNPVNLTTREYEILEFLSLRKGTILTREMFLNHLYGDRDEPELKIIDIFVCKLRKKLAQATGGSHCIETVWGRGYVLRDPTTPPAMSRLATRSALSSRRPP
jgi:two-component system cell cycle response regulator CtrA